MTALPQPAFSASMASAIMQHGLVWAIDANVGLGYWEAALGQTIVQHRADFAQYPELNDPTTQALAYLGSSSLGSSYFGELGATSYYSGDFIGERHEAYGEKAFSLNTDGIAQFSINGPMTKRVAMSASGTSTSVLKRQISLAARDPDVRGGYLKADTPGGSVAGTKDLADAMAAFAAQKPLYVFAEDFMASAGVWATAPATKILATETSHIGSIGTILVIPDLSKMADKAGVTVHVFTNDGADYKGAGTPGTALTDKHKAYFRGMVNELQGHFTQGVMTGRKITAERIKSMGARVFIAAEAQKLGLIDGIGSYQDGYDQLLSAVNGSPGGTTSHPVPNLLVPGFAKQQNEETFMSDETTESTARTAGIVAMALSALGFSPKDAAAAPSTVPGVVVTASHPNALLAALNSVGVKTENEVHTMSAQAEDAKFLRAQLLKETEAQAIRLAGADGKDALMAGMSAMPSSYIVSQRDAFRAQANAKYQITEDSGAERASAAGELPTDPKVGVRTETPDAAHAEADEAAAARLSGMNYARQMQGLPPLAKLP